MSIGIPLAILLLSVASIISGLNNENIFTIIDNVIRNKKTAKK